jgi:hypothetical protein
MFSFKSWRKKREKSPEAGKFPFQIGEEVEMTLNGVCFGADHQGLPFGRERGFKIVADDFGAGHKKRPFPGEYVRVEIRREHGDHADAQIVHNYGPILGGLKGEERLVTITGRDSFDARNVLSYPTDEVTGGIDGVCTSIKSCIYDEKHTRAPVRIMDFCGLKDGGYILFTRLSDESSHLRRILEKQLFIGELQHGYAESENPPDCVLSFSGVPMGRKKRPREVLYVGSSSNMKTIELSGLTYHAGRDVSRLPLGTAIGTLKARLGDSGFPLVIVEPEVLGYTMRVAEDMGLKPEVLTWQKREEIY